METNAEGDYLEFTLLVPGRQSQGFKIHRKDFDALKAEVMLDKLSK